MTAYARIEVGQVRQQTIRNKIFPVLKNFNHGQQGTFITCDGSHTLGEKFKTIRVYTDPDNVSFVSEDDYLATITTAVPNEVEIIKSDQERMDEISERFRMLDLMTKAMLGGRIRGLVVSGPPGVGKSYGVEQEFTKMEMFNDLGAKQKGEMVKGAMSPRGLYEKLYEFSAPGSVLVFDDCDTVLQDELSLNLLKAALDSSDSRYLGWHANTMIKRNGPEIPKRFKFQGSAMFITNVKLDSIRSPKIKPHTDALMSRCHYLDLTLNTMHDKILRVKQIAQTGALFRKYEMKHDMSKDLQNEMLQFMYDNSDKLREVSLRMALKIADCWVVADEDWQDYARNTCMKKGV